jgi:alkanesulfonate monooxygenase SsuD/methylene tetrahydromethanopterin reductase-like flavin-dependent oxidoreductase (luciferase family)
MLRITARHAEEWNTWGHPDSAGERLSAMHAACERVGRDPSTLHTSVQVAVHLSDDATANANALEGPLGPRTIAGGADELIGILNQYSELGFDEFIVPDWLMGSDPAARKDHLNRLHTEVISQL